MEKPFVILGGSRDHDVWQHPAALPKLPIPALVAAPPLLGHKVTVAPTGAKMQKNALKNGKNIASQLRPPQRRKQIQNPLNFAPFHTTDCSMADVKCIYVMGTFPATSWGLGKISAICLREAVVARLEMKVFIFTTPLSIFRKPSCAARGRYSKPCSATNILRCFSPLCLCSPAVPRQKQSLLLPIGFRLSAATQISSSNRLAHVLPNNPLLSDNWFSIFKGKHFFL